MYKKEQIGGKEMFCSKCGTEIEVGNKFCQKCGEKLPIIEENLQGTQEVNHQTYRPVSINNNPTSIKRPKWIGVIIVGVIVVLAIGFATNSIGGRNAKSVIKKLVEGSMEGNGKKLVDLFPQELIDGICEEEGYLNKKEMISVLDEQLQIQLEQVDDTYGKGWKYSYEIVETEDYSVDDLRELRQDYQEDYDVKLAIEEAKEVRIEITTSSKDGKNSSTSTMTVDIIKIEDSWYINGL